TVIRLPGEDDGPVISSKARKILVMYSVDRRAGIVRRKWLRTLQRGEAEFAVGNVFRSTSFPGFVNAGRLLISPQGSQGVCVFSGMEKAFPHAEPRERGQG